MSLREQMAELELVGGSKKEKTLLHEKKKLRRAMIAHILKAHSTQSDINVRAMQYPNVLTVRANCYQKLVYEFI